MRQSKSKEYVDVLMQLSVYGAPALFHVIALRIFKTMTNIVQYPISFQWGANNEQYRSTHSHVLLHPQQQHRMIDEALQRVLVS